jgi:predicted esterase
MRLTHRNFIALAIAGLASLTLGLATAWSQPPQGRGGFGGFTQSNDPRVQNRTYRFEETGEDLPYCVFVSSKVDPDEEAPLIISLHGLGIGPGFMCQGSALDLAEEGGYILAAPMGYSTGGWYGTPVINMGGRGRGAAPGGAPAAAPAGPSDADLQKWSEADVMNVLEMMREEFEIDDDRTYLMGHSMGGAGTLFLGSKHADEWAAIAPIAPAAMRMTDNRAAILQPIEDADLPVLVVHGDMDELVPVDLARTWVATMDELGIEHEYLEVAGATHGPIIEAGMPAIFEFFAKHEK